MCRFCRFFEFYAMYVLKCINYFLGPFDISIVNIFSSLSQVVSYCTGDVDKEIFKASPICFIKETDEILAKLLCLSIFNKQLSSKAPSSTTALVRG